jgi:dCMP deaminase
MLDIASTLAQRGTCKKLEVGCVITDDKDRILGTGYNGNPRGMRHCIDVPCSGADAPRGSDLCEAVHAEQNALLQVHDPDKISKVYVTHSPCMRCTKLLLNTACTTLIVGSTKDWEPAARNLWATSGRALEFEHLNGVSLGSQFQWGDWPDSGPV